MDHSAALIETIAIGLGAAFVGGLIATRLGLPAIVGYLLAGVAVGTVHAGPRGGHAHAPQDWPRSA